MELTVGHTIKILRMQANDGKGMKQCDLEKAIGFSQGKLSRIEIHNEDFMVQRLEDICRVLKTSMTEFFKIKEGM
ncbi:helix-turn-helix transcriptional regulator [Candidatus Pacearchaeota archaeon]|nr:helix-turn-helix transcriptional regulator [Candidatus Pacearchaeota archaeon]